MELTPTPAVDPFDRAVLAHAVTQFVADELGIRVLHVKGHVSRVQFPEREGVSSDVDVMVEPQRVADFVAGLERVGWVVGYAGDDLDLTDHATVLSHDLWGCTVDVHRRFPGFGAGDADVFDALWATRVSLEVAGRPVVAPSRPAHAVIIGLHAARDEKGSRKAGEAAVVWGALSQEERQGAKSLAVDLGAAPRLYLRLPEEFADVPGADDPGLFWRLRSDHPNGAALWIGRMRDSGSLVGAARLLGRALTPHPPPMTQWTTRQRLQNLPAHWAKGLRQLPAAVRMIRGR